jgi:biotin operon repressor
VHASQQNVADAIGSVREVVSRAMLQLRDEGLIARIDDGYEILDAAALHRVISAGDVT